MENHYTKKENDLHQRVSVKAVKVAQEVQKETRDRLATKEGRSEAMARIFSKDV